jgi:hypothetical protein
VNLHDTNLEFVLEQHVFDASPAFRVLGKEILLVSHDFVDELVHLMLELPSDEFRLHLKLSSSDVDLFWFLGLIVSHFL